MEIKTVRKNNVEIAIVNSQELIITDVQSALDLIATVHYEKGSSSIVLNKSAVSEDFFNLKTGLAGEILQKFVTYHVRLAIVGDFTIYKSKSLKDFIYESNKGKHIFFLSDKEQAVDKLSSFPE